MTHEERIAIPIGSIVQYKRDGFTGYSTGRLVARKQVTKRSGPCWKAAIENDHSGRKCWMSLSRVLSLHLDGKGGAA